MSSEWTDRSPHRTGYVRVPGARLQYLDWGGRGPPLILIHGYGDNPHAFDELAEPLRRHFRVLAYARRGHGRSSARGPYTAETFTRDLRAFLDALGTRRATLAGWSMGGNEITEMAGTYPERVDRIVYLDGGYDWSDPDWIRATHAFPGPTAVPRSALRSRSAYRRFIRSVLPDVPRASSIDAYVDGSVAVRANGTVRPYISDRRLAALAQALLSIPRRYDRVRAPALAIFARTFAPIEGVSPTQRAKNRAWERDYARPFRRKSIARLRRELPRVRCVTVEGSHASFFYRNPREVTDLIVRFQATPR